VYRPRVADDHHRLAGNSHTQSNEKLLIKLRGEIANTREMIPRVAEEYRAMVADLRERSRR
jgi:hypothetical protein